MTKRSKSGVNTRRTKSDRRYEPSLLEDSPALLLYKREYGHHSRHRQWSKTPSVLEQTQMHTYMCTDLAIVRITMLPKGRGGVKAVTFRLPPYGTFPGLYDNFEALFP